MTNDQFTALADLLRLRTGPAKECARLVLVEQIPTADAARATGMTYNAAHQAVKRARAGLELARTATADDIERQRTGRQELAKSIVAAFEGVDFTKHKFCLNGDRTISVSSGETLFYEAGEVNRGIDRLNNLIRELTA